MYNVVGTALRGFSFPTIIQAWSYGNQLRKSLKGKKKILIVLPQMPKTYIIHNVKKPPLYNI